MESLSIRIMDKLSGLLFFLKRSKNDFEMVADEVENCPLKTALNHLSADTYYYAGEIKDYLMCLGIKNASIHYDKLEDENFWDVTEEESKDINGHELIALCENRETHLTNAYSELLNEPMPNENLKQLIFYQKNALKNTFQKIKNLNSARFAVY